MRKEELKDYRERLVRRRTEILEQLDHFEEALAYLEQSRPPEFSEEAQEEAAANSLKALDAQERRELSDIMRALDKIDDGSYGECERCSEPIGLARLKALPMVRLCIKCQEKIEKSAPEKSRR